MIYIDKNMKMPLYKQLYKCIVDEIMTGSMSAGDKLPATRKLAEELAVARSTVEKAYHQLEAEGYIRGKIGSGYFVPEIPLDFSDINEETNIKNTAGKTIIKQEKYDFAYGSMDNSNFPYRQWRQCANDVLTSMENRRILNYPNRYGEPDLQEAISNYLRKSRNVKCNPEDILITPGQQHSMEILAVLFENKRLSFGMEEPGYDGIRDVFIKKNYKIETLPVDEDGINLANLQKLNCDLLYLTPSHQFPKGSVLSISKRKKIINWAAESCTYIIEDDYDSELRYYTNPIPAMHSLDRNNMTIYTGTFSKSLAPVMRTAYMILPKKLKEKYIKRYGRYNSYVSTFHQLILAEFIKNGYYEQHINKLRTVYRKKQEALLKAIEKVFGDKITLSPAGAGIHMLMNVESKYNQSELISLAKKADVAFYSTEPLYYNKEKCPQHQLLLGLPTVQEEELEFILRRLHEVWEM